MSTLPAAVVAEDQQLEGEAERSREGLARHRWHWTLDETNPDRVPAREYARSVGRSKNTVLNMVNGYAAWAGRGAPPTELADELERAKLSGDRLAATEAVAEAAGVSVGDRLLRVDS